MRKKLMVFGLLVFGLMVLALPLEGQAQDCGSAPRFNFSDLVPQAQRDLITQAANNAVRALCARSGTGIGEFPIFATPDISELRSLVGQWLGVPPEGVQLGSNLGFVARKALFLYTGNQAWRVDDASTAPVSLRLFYFRTIAHEHFHIVQQVLNNDNYRVRDLESGTNLGPWWLVEGSAEVAAYSAVDYAGLKNYGLTKEENQRRLRELTAVLYDPLRGIDYELSFSAAIALGGDGLDRFVSFWRGIGEGKYWQDAFRETFGMSEKDWYIRFERYRYELIQALTPLSLTFDKAYSPGSHEQLWPRTDHIPYVFRVGGVSTAEFGPGLLSAVKRPADFGATLGYFGWTALIIYVPVAKPTGTYTVGVELPDGRNVYTNFRHTSAADMSPAISSLTPGTVVLGTPGFLLNVEGQGFAPGASAMVNGTSRLARIVSSTVAEVPITGSEIREPGRIGVSIANPGGRSSNQRMLDVSAVPGAVAFGITNVTAGGGTAFQVGDQWRLSVQSAVPGSAVFLRLTSGVSDFGLSGPYGNIDAQGRWNLSGSFDAASIGTWTIQLVLGSTPGPTISFTVR